ncbi:hypothetical protein JL721_118 [Aureococcus anophagefferens]|nr:hypothetical protein JL721_118 [Aureococcus anophagefferens]
MAQVQKLNERELELGISAEASWHAKYKDSAWVYVGGLSTDLSEGDIICVLSQWGEIEDFNYPRDKKTGKPRGWCWAKYEDQRSTILAVDNGNGARPRPRGHYGPADAPKSKFAPGAVYEGKELASAHTLGAGVDVFAPEADRADRVEGWKRLAPADAVARAAKAAKKSKKDGKKDGKKERKKESKKKSHKKEKEPSTSRKRARSDGGDAPLLGYVPEALPAPEAVPLAQQARQGEVVAPSWRGAREPGAPSHYASRFAPRGSRKKPPPPPPQPKRSCDEVERERNKTYGGMNRAR